MPARLLRRARRLPGCAGVMDTRSVWRPDHRAAARRGSRERSVRLRLLRRSAAVLRLGRFLMDTQLKLHRLGPASTSAGGAPGGPSARTIREERNGRRRSRPGALGPRLGRVADAYVVVVGTARATTWLHLLLPVPGAPPTNTCIRGPALQPLPFLADRFLGAPALIRSWAARARPSIASRIRR